MSYCVMVLIHLLFYICVCVYGILRNLLICDARCIDGFPNSIMNMFEFENQENLDCLCGHSLHDAYLSKKSND